jgi:hypothetical protein
MMNYYNEAVTLLHEFLPENAYRNSLAGLLQYTIERVK